MGDFLNPATAISGLQSFLETGGDVLVAIMVATFIMWAFILERFAYWRLSFPVDRRRAIAEWRGVPDKFSRPSHWRREKIISEVRQRAEQNVELIKTLVAIAPLLGLLGTVTGMVAVFDVMAATGSSSARGMSAGVSKATIPTMAGMVSALSGLFLSNLVERAAKNNINRLADDMQIE